MEDCGTACWGSVAVSLLPSAAQALALNPGEERLRDLLVVRRRLELKVAAAAVDDGLDGLGLALGDHHLELPLGCELVSIAPVVFGARGAVDHGRRVTRRAPVAMRERASERHLRGRHLKGSNDVHVRT